MRVIRALSRKVTTALLFALLWLAFPPSGCAIIIHTSIPYTKYRTDVTTVYYTSFALTAFLLPTIGDSKYVNNRNPSSQPKPKASPISHPNRHTYRKCPAGQKFTTRCVDCGSAKFYCVNGKAIEVSRGHYTTGGTWSARTGQAKCGDNAFYCADGVRKKALTTQYTVGGKPSLRTAVKTCNKINKCRVTETCTRWNDQKCGQCKNGFRRVQTDGEPDRCRSKTVGDNDDTNKPQNLSKCRPGFKLNPNPNANAKCVECGAPKYYCVNGVAKKVSRGYYTTGGTQTTRPGQAKCGDPAYYCVNGRHRP